jgi:hypothetical protein
MRRMLIVLAVFGLLLAPSLGSANPNGVGAGDFDYQCGGACHGDASMNGTSTANLILSGEPVAYEGLFTSVTVHLDDATTTASGLVGVFLLADSTGVNDHPSQHGWAIISNSAGTTTNYVEVTLPQGSRSVNVTWTLRAPAAGQHALLAALHHGDGTDGTPYFGESERMDVSVVPVPDDLPRLDPAFTPPANRGIGVTSAVQVAALSTDQLTAEWRDASGHLQQASVESTSEGVWTVALPAALSANTLEWRVTLSGEGPSQTSPWFQLTSAAPQPDIDGTPLYLQAVALALLSAALVIALQHRPTEAAPYDPLEALEGVYRPEVKF